MKFSFLVILFLCHFSSMSFADDLNNKEDYSHRLIWFPIVYYTPETKLAVGALVLKNLEKMGEGRTTHLLSTVSLTQNGQSMVNFSSKHYLDYVNLSEFNTSISARYFPNKYYGRGVVNSLSNPEDYTERSYDMGLNYAWNFNSQYLLRIGGSEEFKKIGDWNSGSLIEQDAQNVSSDLEVTLVNFSLEWDERDYPQAPKDGSWYRLIQTFYGPRDRQQGKILEPFSKIDMDLRKYWSLDESSIVALQIMFSNERGSQIPFQYLNSVGGNTRLRGFYAGQFRDKSLGLTQAEYRYQFKEKWVGTCSLAVGRMASEFSDLSSAQNLISGDLGIHYFLDPENRTKIRFDVGFAQKPGVYLLVGEAF